MSFLYISFDVNWGENLEQVYLYFGWFNAMLIFAFFLPIQTIKQFFPKCIPLYNKWNQLTRKKSKQIGKMNIQ